VRARAATDPTASIRRRTACVPQVFVAAGALLAALLPLLLPAPEVSASTVSTVNTVYVWPGNLYQGSTSDNGLNLRQVGTGSFAIVPGPATPPLGNASAQFTLGPGPGTGRADIWANEFAGTPLRSITEMGYSTYLGPSEPVSSAAVYQLPIYATPGGPTPTFTTLSFQPYSQEVTEGPGWTPWNALSGEWAASNSNLSSQIPGGCQLPTTCTISQIITAFPDAVLNGVDPLTGIGGAGLILGTTVGPATSAANDWSFGVNGVTTVFDFHTGPPPEGYWLTAADGGVFTFGSAPFQGSGSGAALPAPIVGMAPDDGTSYWLVGSDGSVYPHNAGSFGSLSGEHLSAPIVGMAAAPNGGGYYLVASDGGVFAFGDARFEGSMGGQHLNQPVVGMAVTPDGQGYYLVASDGGVFAFGDAKFRGSMGGTPLNRPVVGLAVDATTSGYWMVAADGGVFTFDSPFLGSGAGTHLNAPVVGMATTADDLGYRLVSADGGMFCFGTAEFFGSMAGEPLNKPVVGMASVG